MTTIQDIADKMGISKGTVSKALNGASDISETLQKQVLETAVELGYTKIRRYKNTTKKLCILVEKDNIEYKEPHHFAYDIVVGFKQLAIPAGFQVDVIDLDRQFQRTIGYDAFMLKHDYVGSFVIGFSLADPWMKDFKKSTTPAALYDNYITGNNSTAYVGIDNKEGLNLAISHLQKLGHRKIGYLSTSLGSQVLQFRHNAFFQAMHQNGLKTDPSYAGCSYYISEIMEKHLPRLLKNGMTAIICSQDTIANAALMQCQQMGYKVPEDVSIIGFDDLPICPYTTPPLTTIRQDRIEIGKSSFYALNSLINHVSISTFLLHAQLIERKSTGKAASNK